MSEDGILCHNCNKNQPLDNVTHFSYYECNECFEPLGAVEAVKVSELEELMDRWEGAAEYAIEEADNVREYDGIMGCVEDLKEVIESN